MEKNGLLLRTRRHSRSKVQVRPKVLVIDDDPLCRTTLASALAHQGCEILEASDGFQAISVLSRRGRELDLLIVDTEMPGVHGWEVIRFATRRLPKLRVVRLGRRDDLVPAAEFARFQSLPVLQKPFMPSELGKRKQISASLEKRTASLIRRRCGCALTLLTPTGSTRRQRTG